MGIRDQESMITPTTTQAPVAGTTVGIYTFAYACAPVTLSNGTGKTVYVIVNQVASAPSATDFDMLVPDGLLLDLSLACENSIRYVSVWVPADGVVTGLKVRGVNI